MSFGQGNTRTSMKDSYSTFHQNAGEMVGKPRILQYSTFEHHYMVHGELFPRRVIRLHNTNIVEFQQGDVIVVSCGGWKTVTTKGRINEYIGRKGWHVFTRDGQWMVGKGWSDDRAVPFEEGIELPGNYDTPTESGTLYLVEYARKQLASQKRADRRQELADTRALKASMQHNLPLTGAV